MLKHVIRIVLLMAFAVDTLYAQQTNVPARNHLRTWTATAPEQSSTNLKTRVLRDVKQSTEYYNELGFPIQQVAKEGSLVTGSSPTDVVAPVYYDDMGRAIRTYLPYFETGNTGAFRTNAFTQQSAVLTSFYSSQGETVFYGSTQIENSPLNRTLKSMAPGNNWQGAGRGVQVEHNLNTTADDVKRINVVAAGSYTVAGTYAAGELTETHSIDEHDKRVVEYKDKTGLVVLKKVQIGNNPGASYTGWMCTYYIYDQFNNLRLVVQPRGVELLLQNGWAFTTDILNEQCFRYEYDDLNRMIIKKVPGAGEVYMVYDKRDRLILTQDANLRTQNRWIFTKYDQLNRQVYTGFHTDNVNTTLAAKINDVNNSNAGLFETRNNQLDWSCYTKNQSYPTNVQLSDILSVTYYDDYTWVEWRGPNLQVKNNSFDSYFAAPSDTQYPYPQPLTQSRITLGMVTGTSISPIGQSYSLATIIYYDDRGRVIQTRSDNSAKNSIGTDIVTTQYNFSGQVLQTVLSHQKAGTNAQTHIVVTKYEYDDLGRVKNVKKKINTDVEKTITENSYDALGQLKSKKLSPAFNSNAGIENLTYDYNIRGWMLGMNRNYLTANGQSGTNRFGFELGYDKLTNSSGRNFSNAAQYNGNITGMVWKSDGDDVRRMYSFTYDAANRLMKADFIQHNNYSNDNTWGTNLINYTAQMGDGINPATAYDANGNILSMTQFGWKAGASPSTPIDQLTYGYITNSNRLRAVVDQQNDPNTVLGDFRTPATHPQNGTKNLANINSITDYSYDVNGNLTQDHNKAISSITYNHLNLPQTINITGKGTITYTYDATGNKLWKETVENNVSVAYNGVNYTSNITTTTTYIAGFVYESKIYSNSSLAALNYTDKLQFTGHEEGRIRALYTNATTPHTLTGFAYDYMLKDHLGNVRMVLTDEQQINYYPAATLEGTFSTNNPQANSMVNHEKQFYNIQSNRIVNKPWTNTSLDYANHNGIPPGTPNPNYPTGVSPTQTATSTKVYQLNGSTNRTGLEFVMKVMAGDKIDILGRSYHTNSTTVSNANSTTLNLLQVVTALLGAPANAVGSKGISATQLESWNNGILPGGFIRGNNNETGTSIPKAYVNYIFLDEQFKYAGGGWSRVGASGTVKQHWTDGLQNINVPKNGYLFVYVSNESNFNVFFDNLQVVHTRGPLVEETHYYPFGLVMSGISSKALEFGTPENKMLFGGKEQQSKEFSDGSGLELYDYGSRMYDNQIGRWFTVDGLAEKYASYSPYHFVADNPIRYKELDGRYFVDSKGQKVNISVNKAGQVVVGKNASADLKRIANLVNQSGSKTAVEMFNKLGNNDTKINFKIETNPKPVPLLGLHQAHDKDGKALKWEANTGGTGKFEGKPEYIKDKNGNTAYKEASITLYEGNMNPVQVRAHGENYGGDGSITKDQAMVSIFTHEGYHDTDQKTIDAIKTRQEGGVNNYDVETAAYKMNTQVLSEINEKKKKNK